MAVLQRLVGVGVLLAVTAACGSSPRRAGHAGGDTDRVTPDPAERAAASVNALGVDLLRRNLGTARGNVALSPWSIATALAMVRLGARAATAAELDHVLHAADDLRTSTNALDQELAGRSSAGTELVAANRAFAQRGLALEQPFVDDLTRYYGSSVGLVDYKTAAEAARKEINAWVGDRTRQRIPALIQAGGLDALTRLVVVNAVYFKADWATPFEKERTIDGTFHAPGGDVSTPFMHNELAARFGAGDGWQGVELPYVDKKLAMTIVVPDVGRFDEVVADFGVPLLDRIGAKPPAEVEFALPKFDIDKSLSLQSELSALGMPLAFSDSADFSGMAKDEALAISDVVHQANVTVDEKGTVAAAATAAVMRTTAARANEHTLNVDRPFFFVLRDLPTGTILFAGQVTNPATT